MSSIRCMTYSQKHMHLPAGIYDGHFIRKQSTSRSYLPFPGVSYYHHRDAEHSV